MAKRVQQLQSIRSEGGLLPPDLLRRILDPKEKIPGTLAEDYGLPKGERLNEVITQSYNRLRRHWVEFQEAAGTLPETDPGTRITNEKWSLPLLREMGFGILPVSAGPEISGRMYAINRFAGPTPIHLIGRNLSLDRRSAGVRGAAAVNPHGLVQEFLNRSSGSLWGIVTNGIRLRILRDNQALSRQSFLEFDLEAMFTGELYSDFVLLWLSAHATRFVPRDGGRHETCWLEEWTKISEEQGTRALGELRIGVMKALQILGEGFTSHPRNTALRDALRSGKLSPTVFHGQLLRVIYRLIFLFVADDRILDGLPLLHPRNDTDAARMARERYAAHYSTARLRELAGKIKGSRHSDLWRQFQIPVEALSGEAAFAAAREMLALPALGSFLWNPGATADLNEAELTNHDFLESLRHLAYTRQGKVLRPVDYKNLGAEELGGVYESLLALSPQISADGARFTFAEFAGSERKTSGSYYTPDSLVQCLLDSALDPVVDEAIRGKSGEEAEKAILSLKVCDPAVGSGHFLVGAAHRLARHLARIRAHISGDSEPSPLIHQQALRDVIGHCLYGVDANPMAAELCRVSLWLEALEPGKPLTFLDHHIRVGNSLLGTTPELIAGGIPDDAFNPIEGDDKKICTSFKKKNKQERAGQQSLIPHMVTKSGENNNSLESRIRSIDDTPDDTIDAIRNKAEQFSRLIVSPEYHHAQLVADAWCAAIVWKKQKGSPDPITTDTIGRLEEDLGALVPSQREEVERLAAQYRFFHWHLAFPEVFAQGGFDCVLGNPPWEKLTVLEQEFFSHIPDIANEQRSNRRKALISGLEQSEPQLFKRWTDHQRESYDSQALVSRTGRFPLTAVGELNLFPLFSELVFQIVGPKGEAGIIVKSSLLLSPTWSGFTAMLVDRQCLRAAYDFRNWKGWFPSIGYHERFTLLHFGKTGVKNTKVKLGFYFDSPEDVMSQKLFYLSAKDLVSLNPITKTIPAFESQESKLLLIHIYKRFGIIGSDICEWHLGYTSGFHMTTDASLLRSKEELLEQGYKKTDGMNLKRTTSVFFPLMEGKLLHQFDSRFASFEGIPVENRFGRKAPTTNPSEALKVDPDFCSEPRYWVDSTAVHQDFTKRKVDIRWVFTFRDTTNVISNFRTAVGCICAGWCYNYKAPNLVPNGVADLPAANVLVFCALFNSFPFDYIVRQKFFGANLIKSIIDQLACPSLHDLKPIRPFIEFRALELSYTAWNLKSFAQDFGWSGPPFRWDEDRRFLLRCELDAAFFHIYLAENPDGQWKSTRKSEGAVRDETPEEFAELRKHFPTPRDAVAYIMDTFPIIRRKDEEKHGEYRTKRVILEIYDEMAEAMRTGKSYQTRLDPPPADPRCCHPDKAMT